MVGFCRQRILALRENCTVTNISIVGIFNSSALVIYSVICHGRKLHATVELGRSASRYHGAAGRRRLEQLLLARISIAQRVLLYELTLVRMSLHSRAPTAS